MQNEKIKTKSIVTGNGHGDAHLWFQVKSPEIEESICRYSSYTCRKCYIRFNHMYNYIPKYKYQITGNRRQPKFD